jgi:hypothetical protein
MWKNNAAMGFAYARADAPGGRQEDVKRNAALVKALTGREPRIIELNDGEIDVKCGKSQEVTYNHRSRVY